jgi:hypothetical protein
MSIWSFLRSCTPNPPQNTCDSAPGLQLSPYVGEYLGAIDRTQELGFEAPPRLLVKKDCVDMQTLRPVLLDFFERSPPDSIIGQFSPSGRAVHTSMCSPGTGEPEA